MNTQTVSTDTLGGYTIGQRVAMHPATDRWMRGDRYGTVERVGRKYLSVRMDRSGALVMERPVNLLPVY